MTVRDETLFCPEGKWTVNQITNRDKAYLLLHDPRSDPRLLKRGQVVNRFTTGSRGRCEWLKVQKRREEREREALSFNVSTRICLMERGGGEEEERLTENSGME